MTATPETSTALHDGSDVRVRLNARQRENMTDWVADKPLPDGIDGECAGELFRIEGDVLVVDERNVAVLAAEVRDAASIAWADDDGAADARALERLADKMEEAG